MNAPVRLEQYYPGDEAWDRFVAAAPRGFENFGDSKTLQLALGGDTEMAAVVYAIVGDDAVDWALGPKEMLDGLSPAACLSDAPFRRRLRTMLMRM